ncbi:MAG: 23S rRNA (guanosine(2251)-2'-O)-methyltransferase RlmB [Caldilineaceae bacterium SB0675_bin_29]|uniref:23S rRNA (Guanosine(2251)-2'-O)-methyltransferase RlmB n=1 Tax=Caldilineaceae bacterium SB0675_bin_29 TaxID=2605266 RepID=A0A6B1FZR9_9CHLR|nr:23S rRNA (guanosine(2251)-2'-O)-methyltransferase RlmB [Caldilineaceae bacterium SB0675_bin_29]
MSELLVGRHAVLEAMRAGRRHYYRLWLEGDGRSAPKGNLAEIVNLAQKTRIPTRHVVGGIFDRIRRSQLNPQGVALETGPFPYAELDEILDRAASKPDPLFLVLDHLEDPRNLGTLFRSGEAFGVDGVILPERRAAGITPAVSNASSGAVEHIPVALVGNVNRTIDLLKKLNIWTVGLDLGPDAISLSSADLSGPLAVVIGNEGKGLSRLAREKCDFCVTIPMAGSVDSLNAAIAGSIVLFHAFQARESTAAVSS